MAYDEYLASRIRMAFRDQGVVPEEKKMMGGICWLVDGKMCAGIVKNKLMARIDPDLQEEALTRVGCTEMDFTGKPMKGYVFIDGSGTDFDSDLASWIRMCLDFNPRANKSAKKKR